MQRLLLHGRAQKTASSFRLPFEIHTLSPCKCCGCSKESASAFSRSVMDGNIERLLKQKHQYNKHTQDRTSELRAKRQRTLLSSSLQSASVRKGMIRYLLLVGG